MARGEDPEATHDARIAARRLRTCLSLFRDFIDVRAARKVDRCLKRLVRSLGRLRDMDVLSEDVEAYRSSLSPAAASGLDGFYTTLVSEREGALLRVRRLADSEKTETSHALLRSVAKNILRRPSPSGGVPAGVHAPVLLAAAFARLGAHESLLRGGAADESQYHEARRSAKQLRYALEFFADLLGPAVQGLIDDIKQFQTELGTLNDALAASRHAAAFMTNEVTMRLENSLAARPNLFPQLAKYIERRQRQAEKSIHSFSRIRDRIYSPTFRRRFFQLLGSCPVRFE